MVRWLMSRQAGCRRNGTQNEILSAARIYFSRLRAAGCVASRGEDAGPEPEFAFEKLPAQAVEPLRAELEAFVDAVRSRREPRTSGRSGRAALELAERVMASIQEHGERVQLSAFAAAQKTDE